MNNSMRIMLVVCLCAVSAVARALEFEGVNFPDKLRLDGADAELQLNGVGFRTKFIFDVYIGALYTVSKVESRDAVRALKGPNRMQMNFVYSEVDKEKLVSAWNEGFEENNADDRLAALAERIRKFNAMFPTLVEGDVVLLDYDPGKGTTVTIKGEVKGIIEGEDFNLALLDIWLGEHPADADLKKELLGQ